MSEPAIRASLVCKSYPSAGRKLEVLRGLSLEVDGGGMVAVVGEAGVGKSTLLHLLGALDRPDTGSIWIGGEEVGQLSPDKRSAFRNRQIGFVFQFHHLLPEFSAEENAMLPCLIRRMPAGEARRKARGLLEELGLQDRANHRPSQLSGGEQQRVAIARALVGEPSFLLADEPTGNLDFRTSEAVFDLIRKAVSKRGTTTVLVTHSERLARRCDRVYVMEEGALRNLSGSSYRFGLESPAIPI